MIVSINTTAARGHKTKIKINKKGVILGATITHSPITANKKNIPLQENPQNGHSEQAYVVRKQTKTTIKNTGKIHSDIKTKNPIDKSIMRHIIKKKK